MLFLQPSGLTRMSKEAFTDHVFSRMVFDAYALEHDKPRYVQHVHDTYDYDEGKLMIYIGSGWHVHSLTRTVGDDDMVFMTKVDFAEVRSHLKPRFLLAGFSFNAANTRSYSPKWTDLRGFALRSENKSLLWGLVNGIERMEKVDNLLM